MYTPTILTPSILSRAHRRTFQPYVCTRSPDIWPTRTALLAYEHALELEAQIDTLNSTTLSLARARSRSRSVTSHLLDSPVKGEPSATKENVGEDNLGNESQRIRDARQVLAIFEIAYAEWKALGDSNGNPRPRGLERFDRGTIRSHTHTHWHFYPCARAFQQVMSSRALCKKVQKLSALCESMTASSKCLRLC